MDIVTVRRHATGSIQRADTVSMKTSQDQEQAVHLNHPIIGIIK